jgi:outer membrane protein
LNKLNFLAGLILISFAGALNASPIAMLTEIGYQHSKCPSDVSLKLLSLKEVLLLSMGSSSHRRIALVELDQSRRNLTIAKSDYYPELNYSVDSTVSSLSASYNAGPPTNRTAEISQKLSARWLLFDSGARRANVDHYKALDEAKFWHWTVVTNDILLQSAALYYDVLLSQNRLRSYVQVSDVLERSLAVADAHFKKGLSPYSDALKAKIAYDKSVADVNRARGIFSKKTGHLATLIGCHSSVEIQLQENIRDTFTRDIFSDLDQLLELSQEFNPQIKAARARVQASLHVVESERASGRPTVMLAANVSNSRAYRPDVLSGNRNNNHNAIMFSLNIPLDPWGKRRMLMERAAQQANIRLIEAEFIEETVRAKLWSDYQELMGARKLIEQSGHLVQNSLLSLNIIEGRYRSGVGSLAEVLQSTETYLTLAEQSFEDIVDLNLSHLRIATAIGRASIGNSLEIGP